MRSGSVPTKKPTRAATSGRSRLLTGVPITTSSVRACRPSSTAHSASTATYGVTCAPAAVSRSRAVVAGSRTKGTVPPRYD